MMWILAGYYLMAIAILGQVYGMDTALPLGAKIALLAPLVLVPVVVALTGRSRRD